MLLFLLPPIFSTPPQEPGGAWELVAFTAGPEPTADFGAAVGGVGDLNGDRRDEVLVGAPRSDRGALVDAGAVYVLSGHDASILARLDGLQSGDHLGQTLPRRLGDVNGDLVPDILAGAPLASPGGPNRAGSVLLFSVAPGTLRLRPVGTEDNGLLGWSLDGVGDLNGDRRPDYAVGARNASPVGQAGAGEVIVYSGLDGGVLAVLPGEAAGEQAGFVAGAGDVDLDGTPDLFVGAPGASPLGRFAAGEARLYRGIDFQVHLRLPGFQELDRMGSSVAPAGDADRDGTPDLLAGAAGADTAAGNAAGRAYVFSGASGAVLCTVDGNREIQNLGDECAGAGDFNADGYSDAVIGHTRAYGPLGEHHFGAVYVCSGRTGGLLALLQGAAGDDGHWGKSVVLDDADGDGRHDIAAVSERITMGSGLVGGLWVFRFAPYLVADADRLSAVQGGSVHFALEFPASAAASPYQLLGSGAGVGPTLVDGVAVPLSADRLFLVSRAGGLPARYFTGATGVLDGAGAANVHLSVPPGALGALVGSDFYWAAVTTTAGGAVSASSVAVALRVLP